MESAIVRDWWTSGSWRRFTPQGDKKNSFPNKIRINGVVTGTADILPTLSVADAGANEANGSIGFRVTLDPTVDGTVTVDYATADGTAVAGSDSTATSGTLTFEPGDDAKTVQVPLLDDDVEDDGETFTLTLSNAAGATIHDGEATGTILNSEALTASFQDVPAGHNGADRFSFDIAFSEDTDISSSDFRNFALDVTYGEATRARRVNGRHDLWKVTVWPDFERHNLPLSASDVTIVLEADRACDEDGAVCTSDGKQLSTELEIVVPYEAASEPSELSVADAEANEEDDATLNFAVTLDPAADEAVTVDYATSDGGGRLHGHERRADVRPGRDGENDRGSDHGRHDRGRRRR